jgi:hypothetical protein
VKAASRKDWPWYPPCTKNLLLHHQVVLPITNGRIDFGRGPRLFSCEFDGQGTNALPHQESDFEFFKKHSLCGSWLHFSISVPLERFPLTQKVWKQL